VTADQDEDQDQDQADAATAAAEDDEDGVLPLDVLAERVTDVMLELEAIEADVSHHRRAAHENRADLDRLSHAQSRLNQGWAALAQCRHNLRGNA
jgi:hypothetical protein